MGVSTVKIHSQTKQELDSFREYKNESYDEVIRKVTYIARNREKDARLSDEAIKAIEKARERIRKGQWVSEADAKKRLGL